MSGENINFSKELVGQNTTTYSGRDVYEASSKASPPVVHKAVVTEIITDPGALSDEDLVDLHKRVDNEDLVQVIPINAIVAIRVNDSNGLIGQETILLPFFPSHLQLPIKVGELVHVLYPDYSGTGTGLGYWFARSSSHGNIEDVNYSHDDRRHDATYNKGNYSLADRNKIGENKEPPGFPNGGLGQDSLTLLEDGSSNKKTDNRYEQIKKASKAFELSTREPVPTFRKRPGDYVIQGSNNTLISLGEDRYSSVDDKDNKDYKGQSGTIDIVVGRGRKLATADSSKAPSGTSTRVVKNSRGEFEADRAPFRRGFDKKLNPNEGNPDLKNDAARIYVSMQTNGDENFELNLNSGNGNSIQLPELPPPSKESSFGKSFIVGKSDHIRLIARKGDENDSSETVKGTVLLIKEGEPDEDLGYFFINDEGNIQIESKKIYLGLAHPDKQENPLVLYENYHDTILALQSQIDAMALDLNTAFSTAFGNLGIVIPSFATLASKPGTNTRLVGLPGVVADAGGTAVKKYTTPKWHSNKVFLENATDGGEGVYIPANKRKGQRD